ncbi:MAG: redoxin, partial [Actinomycetota bacterium]
DGIIFLEGQWRSTEEYLEAAGDGARVLLPFYAKDVFFVASAGAGGRVSVRLTLDGRPVPAGALGKDAPDGIVPVGRSDLFAVLTLTEAGTHVLTLEAEAGFRLYTFTFG